MPYFQGKSSYISSNGAQMPTSDWSLQWSCDAIDVTNMQSAGYNENIDGVHKAQISCSGPYTGDFAIAPGDEVHWVIGCGIGIGFPSFTVFARITDFSLKSSVRGAVEFDCSAESNGVFTLVI